jgi:hypothetical protein
MKPPEKFGIVVGFHCIMGSHIGEIPPPKSHLVQKSLFTEKQIWQL